MILISSGKKVNLYNNHLLQPLSDIVFQQKQNLHLVLTKIVLYVLLIDLLNLFLYIVLIKLKNQICKGLLMFIQPILIELVAKFLENYVFYLLFLFYRINHILFDELKHFLPNHSLLFHLCTNFSHFHL